MATRRRYLKTASLREELGALQARGVTLPRHPAARAKTARAIANAVHTPGALDADVRGDASRELEVRRNRPVVYSHGNDRAQHEHNLKQLAEMRMSRGRGAGMRQSSFRRFGSNDAVAAIPRFYDPMEFWDLSGMPFNMADEAHRHKLHKWMRLYYATHPIVPTLVDIYTRFPLAGLELYSKDKKLTAFYEDLFLDRHRLNYPDFLVSMGREYWLVGEAFPLGSFNESLGVWEREELLNPEDIVVERVPFMGETYLKVKPPEHMKRLVRTKTPPKEYKLLVEGFPELVPYLLKGEPFVISKVLLKHIKFALTDFDDHGTPILLRALRTLMHEEKLLASQDAIAERLYSPLILAKLGMQDLGGNAGPFIPGPDDLEALRDDIDLAMASDYRVLVSHFALEMSNVFGREQMPNLGDDFDRIERRLMQVFGINPALLSGGANSTPYASTALSAEFMNQMLRTYQGFLKDHFYERAEIVAEAQEHWDYEKRGNTRVPIMEEVIDFDEETGEAYIEQRHKLLTPQMDMQSLDLRDEATQRQFLMALRQMGVPISDERLMVGLNFSFEDSLDELSEEAIQKTVAQQMAKLQAYKIMLQGGMPIPPDLKAEVESIQAPGTPGAAGMQTPPPPTGSPGDPNAPGQDSVGVPPQGGQIVMPPAPQLDGAQDAEPAGGPAGDGSAPNISFDQRGTGFDQPVNGANPYLGSALEGWKNFKHASIPAEADSPDPSDRANLYEWANERVAYYQEVWVQLEIRRRERKTSRFERTVLTREEIEDKAEWETDKGAWLYGKRVIGKRFANLERRVAENQSDFRIVAVLPYDEVYGEA